MKKTTLVVRKVSFGATTLQKSERAMPILFHRPKRQKTTQQRRPNYDRLLADFAAIRRVSELRRQGVNV